MILTGLPRFLKFLVRILRDDFLLIQRFLRLHRRLRTLILALTAFAVLATIVGTSTLLNHFFGGFSVVQGGSHSGSTTGTTGNSPGATDMSGMAVTGSAGAVRVDHSPTVIGADHLPAGSSVPTSTGARSMVGGY